jgi:hypothetical protein
VIGNAARIPIMTVPTIVRSVAVWRSSRAGDASSGGPLGTDTGTAHMRTSGGIQRSKAAAGRGDRSLPRSRYSRGTYDEPGRRGAQ